MGNLVTQLEQPSIKVEIESSVIEDLRSATFGTVIEARKGFLDDYGPRKVMLDADEFDLILGPLLSDTEEGFRVFEQGGTASVKEIFTAAFIFCAGATLDQKLEAIFYMFDADGSGSMNAVEIEIMTEATLLGMAKVAGLRLPESKVVEEMADRLFIFLNRRNQSAGDLCRVHELKDFISMQDDILRFLAIFTDAHLITYSKREVDRITRDTVSRFIELASNQSDYNADKPVLSAKLTGEVLQSIEGMHTSKAEVNKLLDLLTCDGRGKKVSVNAFKAVVQPWVAFDVLDRDKSGSLDRKELKALLWISKGLDTPEPTDHAVRAAIMELDKNGDRTIDRLEWTEYTGKLTGLGTLTFADTIRMMFVEYDKDRSGTITRTELQALFLDLLQKSADTVADIQLLSKDSQDVLRGMFHNSITALLDDMDERGGGKGMINWKEFRSHKKDIDSTIERIRTFVQLLIEQDATDNMLSCEEKAGGVRDDDDENNSTNGRSLAAIFSLQGV